MSSASLPRAWRSASSTAGSTRGSSSPSIECSTPTLISLPTAPSAEASAERTRKSGSRSRPESTSAKSSGLVRASAAKAAARTQGSRSATSATSRGRSAGSGGSSASARRASRRSDVAARGEQRRGGRGPAGVADRPQRAQRVQGDRRVRVAHERQQQLDRRGVLQRPEAARGERPRAGIVRGDRRRQHRAQRRVLEPHRDPGRRPPVEARAACGEQRRLRRRAILQPRQRHERQAVLGPAVGRVAGVVAAHGHPADRLGQGVDDQLRDQRRRARVPDASERLGRPAAHPASRVAERRQQPLATGRVADEPEREGRHAPHLDLRIVHQLDERRHETGIADPPGGERGAPAHAAVGVAQQSRQGALAGRALVLELDEAGQTLAARRQRRRDRLLGREHAGVRQRSEQRGRGERAREAEAGRGASSEIIAYATAKKSRPSASPSRAASARIRSRAPGWPTAPRCSAPRDRRGFVEPEHRHVVNARADLARVDLDEGRHALAGRAQARATTTCRSAPSPRSRRGAPASGPRASASSLVARKRAGA